VVAVFANSGDMERRTGGAITAATHPFLDDELKAAAALIRAACGWHVAPRREVTVSQRVGFARDVRLPAMEIHSVVSVTLDGVLVAPELVLFDRATGWTNLRGASWDVTFVAGFDDVPPDLVALTLQVAARALSSPTGVTREQIGQHSVSFSLTGAQSAGGAVLLPSEREQLVPYTLGALP